ncbi:YjbH domain-containing protein [Vibrio sp. SCSIO 43136]|uniref:YjbH domain-containing protein n=1 Tax=Vibrio sp. SCSIO 43136 TaxID=2819101 RepID=UPI002075CD08|nr:YjbH domain-containing protein [Vibrio sp. SCSIO 43136]USD65134.1 YjbH domain-containing protein [Vibrio sp. SCSIO 43136]
MKKTLISLAVLAALPTMAGTFQPPQFTPSQMDFGGTGLMQMPSGRVSPEGEFSLNFNDNNEYQFYSVSLALMPWLESTIRYTIVPNVRYSSDDSFSGDNPYADKGIDVKVRLLEESDLLPEVSVGIRDFGGTGLFDGEFIAASKKYVHQDYGVFDFTLGLGFGYMGTRSNITNPFCKASDGFCSRNTSFGGNGGMIDSQRWFRGPAAVYGGVEYQTPYQPLVIKLEYDGNNYSEEWATSATSIFYPVNMTPHTPFNIGVNYALTSVIDLRLAYQRGDTLTAGVTIHTNYNDITSHWVDDPAPRPSEQRPKSVEEVDWAALEQEVAKVAGYKEASIYLEGDTVTVRGEQKKYRDRELAHEKAAAVLSNALPETISTYHLVETKQDLALTETEVDAGKYQDIANVAYINPKISDATTQSAPKKEYGEKQADGFERLDYGLAPNLRQSFGSAEDFYLYAFGINANASYWLTRNLQLSGGIYLNLIDNYDQLSYITPVDGVVGPPRVRTMVRAYVSDNVARMNSLQLTWFDQYGSDFYHQMYGGYLEMMFAGVGTEVLYRPRGSNWAVGADINLISQRDPETWFGVYDQPNQSNPDYGRDFIVLDKGTTGFVSAYYMPEWSFLENTLFKVDVGQFLAQDKGVRLDFSKQFKSGIIAGAYASKTDMSVEDFGEGSFTKGFYISIPFDVMTVKPSNQRALLGWQPITRDGGQKLNRQHELFSETDAVSPWFSRP